MRAIGERLGPFDLTMIEVGQYDQVWPDWHLGPEQAVEAHRRVRGAVILPVYWALFALASHTWTEPIERAVAASQRTGSAILTPRPGQSVEPHGREAPGALVARAPSAHGGRVPDRRRPRRLTSASTALAPAAPSPRRVT